MNVADTVAVDSNVLYLRSNIYNDERFKNFFQEELNRMIPIDAMNFIAEQYGGWSVYINLKEGNVIDSYMAIRDIVIALRTTIICDMRDPNLTDNDISSIIFGIVMTGNSSFVIKI